MANQQFNLQDNFLNRARVDKVPLTMFLMNGVQVKGRITSFDQFSILMETSSKQQQLIYKHAVSTIIPAKPINPNEAKEETAEEN